MTTAAQVDAEIRSLLAAGKWTTNTRGEPVDWRSPRFKQGGVYTLRLGGEPYLTPEQSAQRTRELWLLNRRALYAKPKKESEQ